MQSIYHVSPKRPPFIFLNNSVKNEPIVIILGMLNLLNPEKIWHGLLTDLSTCQIKGGRFFLGYSVYGLINEKIHVTL